MCSKSMPMKDHSSLANQLAWWVVCVAYILSKLKDSFSCSWLYYVKTVKDFDTIQCVICFVCVRGLLIQPSCVRLTWYIFHSLKELTSPSQATMTAEVVDRTLQSGLRWFSFSQPNCVFPPLNIRIMQLFSMQCFFIVLALYILLLFLLGTFISCFPWIF